jgi:hypothetical protein
MIFHKYKVSLLAITSTRSFRASGGIHVTALLPQRDGVVTENELRERRFFLSSARAIAAALCPFFHRSHSSAFCAAVNQIRDVTMAHLLIPQD